MVAVVEGEEDALSAYQMFQNAKRDYAVVSIPNGASQDGALDRQVLENLDWLREKQLVVLMLDQDEPGQATTETIASHIAPDTTVQVATLPAKDANDLLKEGREQEFMQAFWAKEAYQPEKLEHGSDVAFADVYTPLKRGAWVGQFPITMNMMQGLRGGELSTILAPPGVGKTTVCREITYSLISQGYKVACFMLEETTIKSRQGLIAIDNDVPLWKFRQDPSIVNEEAAQESYDKFFGSDLCHFVKHRGSMSDDALLSIVRWYNEVENVDYIVLDHLSMVFSGRGSDNERAEIDTLLTNLAAMVEDLGVHMLAVSHIRREGGSKWYVNDEEHDAQWQYVGYDTGRGSGAFEQLAHNLIALEPEILDSGERGRVRISIRKNREIGTMGPADVIKMNQATGRLEPVQESEF